MSYSIKQAAQMAQLMPHTLRYYEKEGLLPFVGRTKNGNRQFSDDDMEWLELICCLKSTGMPIREIREFVLLSMEGDHTLAARCDMLKAHKRSVERQMEEMRCHLEKVTCKINCYNKKYLSYLAQPEQIAQP